MGHQWLHCGTPWIVSGSIQPTTALKTALSCHWVREDRSSPRFANSGCTQPHVEGFPPDVGKRAMTLCYLILTNHVIPTFTGVTEKHVDVSLLSSSDCSGVAIPAVCNCACIIVRVKPEINLKTIFSNTQHFAVYVRCMPSRRLWRLDTPLVLALPTIDREKWHVNSSSISRSSLF